MKSWCYHGICIIALKDILAIKVICTLQAAAAEGIVKQMEAKTYSCSECGLKTPSRMTYIQVSTHT